MINDTVRNDFSYKNFGLKNKLFDCYMRVNTQVYNLDRSITVYRHITVGQSKTGSPETLKFIEILEQTPLAFIREDEEAITSWKAAFMGFPSKSVGSFWRMFYFSAITITTVGFGDIVPITDGARFWVATEAILGIILIGLFLNSLADSFKGQK
jgi:hypothetical protein